MKQSDCPTILLIDSDAATRRVLRHCLSCVDCCLLEASAAAQGLALVRSFRPTLVLADMSLPDMDGVDVIREIRGGKYSIVIAVSSTCDLNSVTAALDAGADDFIPKPFSAAELGARVRVALRHAAMSEKTRTTTFRAGELEVDLRQRRVSISGTEVHLTPLEYRLLSLLIHNAGRTLTYDRLLGAWQSGEQRHLQHIRVLMCQLRRKLEPDPAKPRRLVNAYGVGYQLQLGDNRFVPSQ
jgi:two-component system KDP operon response regulator KdpE